MYKPLSIAGSFVWHLSVERKKNGMLSSHDENIPSQNLYRDEKTIRMNQEVLRLVSDLLMLQS